jgi:hypothetical protein
LYNLRRQGEIDQVLAGDDMFHGEGSESA